MMRVVGTVFVLLLMVAASAAAAMAVMTAEEARNQPGNQPDCNHLANCPRPTSPDQTDDIICEPFTISILSNCTVGWVGLHGSVLWNPQDPNIKCNNCTKYLHFNVEKPWPFKLTIYVSGLDGLWDVTDGGKTAMEIPPYGDRDKPQSDFPVSTPSQNNKASILTAGIVDPYSVSFHYRVKPL